jgi:hypothetical protein
MGVCAEDIKTSESVRKLVIETVMGVAREQGKTLAPLLDQTPLLESGLDSLCIAIIVTRLDDQLGVDPFGATDDLTLPVTMGDFIQIYEHAAP